MKLTKLLLLLLGQTIATQAVAQTDGYVMHVKLIDDTVDKYVVSEKLRMRIEDGRAYVYSSSMEASYNVDSIAEYTFVDFETGVEDVEEDAAASGVEVRFLNNETVFIKGADNNVNARVYSLSGQPVNAAVSKTEGGISISLASLPSGAYIIYINKEKSIKVMKK